MSVVSAANRVADEAVVHVTLFWRRATAAMRPYRLTALAAVCGVAGWLTAARSGAIGWITVLVVFLAVAACAAFGVRAVTLLRLRARLVRPGTRGIADVRLLARSERALFAAVGFSTATIFLGAGQLLAIPVAQLPVSGFVTAFFLLLGGAVVLSQARFDRRPQSAVTAFCAPRVEIAPTPEQAMAALRHRLAISRGLQEVYSQQGMSAARSILSIAETAGKGDGAASWPSIRLSLFPSVLRGIVGRFAASVGLLRHALAAAILALIMAYIVPANALPNIPGPTNIFALANEDQENGSSDTRNTSSDTRNTQSVPRDAESAGGARAQDDTGPAAGDDGADEPPARQVAASAQDGTAQGSNRDRDQGAEAEPRKRDGSGGNGASEAGDGADGSETSQSEAGGAPRATRQGQEGSPGNSQGGGAEPNAGESGLTDRGNGAIPGTSGNQTDASSSSATSPGGQSEPTGTVNDNEGSTKPGNDGTESPGKAASSGSNSQNGNGAGDGKGGSELGPGANSNGSPSSREASASSEPNSGGAGGAEAQGRDGSQTKDTTQGGASGDTAVAGEGEATRASGGSDAQSESGIDAGDSSGSGQDTSPAQNPAKPGEGEPTGQNPGASGTDSALRAGDNVDNNGSGDTKPAGDGVEGGEGGADSGNQESGEQTTTESDPGNQAGEAKSNRDQPGQIQSAGGGSQAQPNSDETTDAKTSGQSSRVRSGGNDAQDIIPSSAQDGQDDPLDAGNQSNSTQADAAKNGALKAGGAGAADDQPAGSVGRENAQGQPLEKPQAGEAGGAAQGGSGEEQVASGDRRATGGSETQTADPLGQPGGTNVQTETEHGVGKGQSSPGVVAGEVQGDPAGREAVPLDGLGGVDLENPGAQTGSEDLAPDSSTVRLTIPGATATQDQGAVATSRAPASPFAATGKAPETIEAVPQSSAGLPDAPARALPPEQRLPSWVVDLFE